MFIKQFLYYSFIIILSNIFNYNIIILIIMQFKYIYYIKLYKYLFYILKIIDVFIVHNYYTNI